MIKAITTPKGEVVHTPNFIKALFNHPLMAWVWLPIRVWLGWQWLEAGLHKIESAAWMQTGAALQGYWTKAIAIPATGNPPIHYAWYRSFLTFLLDTNSYTWFAKFVAVGELLVGIALILGLFTWFASLMGGLMNWSYVMAGSASTNPMLLLLAVFLVLAWKVAGNIGLDRFIVPAMARLWTRKQEKPETVPAGIPQGAEAQ